MKIKENDLYKLEKEKPEILLGKIKKKVKISFIVPTYKRTKLLEECIKSILAQKECCTYEIIIIDDNPDLKNRDNEELVKYLNRENILYYKNRKNLGIYNNMNMGSLLSNGEWICFLHDDDLLEKYFLEEILNILENKPDIALLDNRIKLLDMRTVKRKKNQVLKEFIKNKIYNTKKLMKLNKLDFYYYADIGGVGTIINKKIFIKEGGFNNIYYPSSDYYLWINMFIKNYNMYIYNKQLSVRRFEENESLKLEVVEKFIINDFFLKEKLAGKTKILKKMKRYLCIRNINIWKKEWKINIDEKKIYKILNMKDINKKDIVISKLIGLFFILRKLKRIMM
ncbi:Glycosyl transferase family 2 [Cetobacterium ceti]|uniref:Glycosyl transferase family 2 n=1 Tax=Cetobacterium ceti TaxID=180163 RepID=A0A1T4LSR4_9FUSO|nr:glycosyltransferase family 2 protein [Cetobacterium ceti]SJZ57779.1 Glycosyl transferase family 2 [Cetobacterium ceti]